jgi:hypothetical protein
VAWIQDLGGKALSGIFSAIIVDSLINSTSKKAKKKPHKSTTKNRGLLERQQE